MEPTPTRDRTADDLDAAVLAARHRYTELRPGSREWAERGRATLAGGSSRSSLDVEPFPIRVLRADGSALWDVDGFRYVDLLGDFTAGLLGHNPAPVLAAAGRALERGWSLGALHRDEVHLAEAIVERFPSIEQVRFTNSGTEANLLALGVATHHAGRRRIVVFEHAYHGALLTFGRTANAINVPHDWLLLPYNDADAARTAFQRDGDSIAAVIVEPMQGSAGCFPGDPEFLATLRALCTEHGALLIFDEVMTSRLSRGGAQLTLGIMPDVTTLGKYLAGGLTFGAFGGRSDVMVHFDRARGGTLSHAGTFNNNVATMAAGVAALTEVLDDDRLAATNARGDRLRRALCATFQRHRVPMSATGMGSLLNVHASAGPVRSGADLDDADDRWKELFYFACLDAGFYLARRGFIALSIEITDDDVAAFLDVVDQWCAEREAELPP
jgi:glutamate-1-semialdehyde 2,1-aminomutase